MNKYRLAEALNISILDLHVGETRWVVRRCQVCGKLGQCSSLIAEYCDAAPIKMICRDHGGAEGRTVQDALTGCWNGLPPSPGIVRKIVRDLANENAYWFNVLLRYVRFTLRDYWCYVRHPIKAYRFYKEYDKWFW